MRNRQEYVWLDVGRMKACFPCSPSLLYPTPQKISYLPAVKNKASFEPFLLLLLSFFYGERTRVLKRGQPMSSAQHLPSIPEEKQAARKEEREKENMPFPAPPPWQRADWPKPGKGSLLRCYRADLEILGGWRQGGGSRTPARLRREWSMHRAGFVMLDSSSPPPAHWDTASAALFLALLFGGGNEGSGGVPCSCLVCSSLRGAQLNVLIVPGAAIGTRPGLPGQGPGPRGLRGREGK